MRVSATFHELEHLCSFLGMTSSPTSEETLENSNSCFFCFTLSAQCLFYVFPELCCFCCVSRRSIVERTSQPGARTGSHGKPVGFHFLAHWFCLFVLPGSVEPFDLGCQILKPIKKLT